jgi:ribosomal subunit interface protein
MAIQVTGKNLDLGDALRQYVVDRVGGAVGKYMEGGLSGFISIAKERAAFQTNCSLHLHAGFNVEASGEAHDPYASVEAAVEHLEKRLRRYKGRLKSHHYESQSAVLESGLESVDYLIHHDEDSDEEAPADGALAPAIIAETRTTIRDLSVSDAVMNLDLTNQQFVIFRNASHGRINIVYRRSDGHIGWIDPGGVSGGNAA